MKRESEKLDNTEKPQKRTGAIVIGVIVAVAVLAGAGFALKGYQDKKFQEHMREVVEQDTIYEGISVNGETIGGMTKDDAETHLSNTLQTSLSSQEIVLSYEDQSWTISYEDLKARFDLDQAAQEAYQVAREGSLEERYQYITKIAEQKMDIEAPYSYDLNPARDLLAEIGKKIDVEPKDSGMTRKDGKFVITDEVMGSSLDEEQALQDLEAMVSARQAGNLALAVKETAPEITREMNEQATDLIGSFSTNFTGSMALGRNINLKVGCDNINGTILKPGETFSMNEGLGPQTYANGYRNAAVIINGKVEDGIAGGVCQVTTTLYNSVILAELEVVERKNHSLAVAYVPQGRDAAVAGDYKDLKFKNDTDYPVYIEAFVADNKVVTNLYGHEIHDPGRKVEFEQIRTGTIPKPAEKITEDPNRPEGEREVTYTGKAGSKVTTNKLVYENDVLISKAWFSDSTYIATADEVTVGTKKKETDQQNQPSDGLGGEGVVEQENAVDQGNAVGQENAVDQGNAAGQENATNQEASDFVPVGSE